MELMVDLYAAVVAICIVAFVVVPAIRRQRPGLQVREGLARVVVEYIGNACYLEGEPLEGHERRRNRAARVLMDYVRGRSEASDVPPHELERVLEELRHAIRSAEPLE